MKFSSKKLIITIFGIILLINQNINIVWGTTIKKNLDNTNFFYRNQKNFSQHNYFYNISNNYFTHSLSNNNIKTHSLFHNDLYLNFFKNRISLKKDCINISYVFPIHYYSHNSYIHKQIFPFIQLGIQNFSTEKIFSVGSGNRHIYNNEKFIGYNILYHYTQSHFKNLNIINIGGEYYFNRTLFSLNTFYNINYILHNKKLLQNVIQPCNGYQINIKNTLLNFPKITGNIKLEYFFYNKKIDEIFFNKKNKNCCLTLNIDYFLKPELSFGIENVFIDNKYDHTDYQVSINFPFNTSTVKPNIYFPIFKKNSSALNYINCIIEPFIPYQKKINYDINSILIPKINKKVTGHPGEIKITAINNQSDNKKYKKIKQNIQSLYDYEGKIDAINKNTYLIHFPNNSKIKDEKISITYYDENDHQENNIFINTKSFKTEKKSHSSTPVSNHEHYYDEIVKDDFFSKNHNDHTIYAPEPIDLTFYNNKYDNEKNESYINKQDSYHMAQDEYANDDINIIHHSSYVSENHIPSPPPMINLSSISSISTENNTEKTFLINTYVSSSNDNSTLQKNKSKYDITEHENISFAESYSESNSDIYSTKKNSQNINITDDILNQNTSNKNFCDLISIHKKFKFSLIGTQEHLEKLEKNTITKHKNPHHNDIEQIFSRRLSFAHSSSSSIEDDTYLNSDIRPKEK